jgi:chloramphenicol 3-O-phosphotransferase
MASITIVSGSPAAGKTTLASRLAREASRGVHVEGDAFFEFLAHPIDPTRVESHAQNCTVLCAQARAVRAYADGGYDVFLDGVVGPWFLGCFARALLPEFRRVDYVVLRAALGEVDRRAGARTAQPVPPATVAQMHRAFADLGRFEPHALETTGLDRDAVAAEFARRRARGAFRLELERIAPGGA